MVWFISSVSDLLISCPFRGRVDLDFAVCHDSLALGRTGEWYQMTPYLDFVDLSDYRSV